MKLIVGLGNPDKKYENTRHNVGFMCLDKYLEIKNIDLKFKKKFNSLYLETIINGEKVIFIKPLTYMNNSGEAVRKFSDFYKIKANDILVISDDLDLDLGKFRLRYNGSSGGHNGLNSIINHLGTNEFKRLRIGIDKNTNNIVDYVLSKFRKEELEVLDDLFKNLSLVIDDYFVVDFTTLMSRYNRRG